MTEEQITSLVDDISSIDSSLELGVLIMVLVFIRLLWRKKL